MAEDFIPIDVKKKYTCWENEVKCSPPPKYRHLLEAMNKANGDKKMGNTLNQIVKEYFNQMPPEQKEQLLAASKNE